MALRAEFGERTINELHLMFKNRQINLSPGFQRQSVWSRSDRRRLMQSILAGYPVPSVFLYKRDHRGGLVYDVIDGKQRLETIFMFMGAGRFKSDQFDIKADLGDGPEAAYWVDIRKYAPQLRRVLEGYKIQTVEVTGELSEIIDLFVRINSTGKPLTTGEKRHARFYESRFLKEAAHLLQRNRRYFLAQRILTSTQIARMKGTELIAELLISVQQGGIINKKTALDRAIGNEKVHLNTLRRVSRETTATINQIKRILPDLTRTRFHNTAEYYSLFMLVWQMREDGFVLNDRKRNAMAERLLVRLSTGVDTLRNNLRAAKPASAPQRLFADYLLTVQGDTDSAANRKRRAEILGNLLRPLFEAKDGKRTFSAEQRRILWNSIDRRNCPTCNKQLTWDNVSVDHILAHTKGGKTTLGNAQLICRSCNSRKGSR